MNEWPRTGLVPSVWMGSADREGARSLVAVILCLLGTAGLWSKPRDDADWRRRRAGDHAAPSSCRLGTRGRTERGLGRWRWPPARRRGGKEKKEGGRQERDFISWRLGKRHFSADWVPVPAAAWQLSVNGGTGGVAPLEQSLEHHWRSRFIAVARHAVPGLVPPCAVHPGPNRLLNLSRLKMIPINRRWAKSDPAMGPSPAQTDCEPARKYPDPGQEGSG